ncbi:MAG: NfeD family protein [Planctomycetota bacterium]
MPEFLQLLFDWNDLLDRFGFDAVIYAAFALLGTIVFLLRMGASLLFGIDGDADFDADVDGDGFGLLSVLSVTAFLMGTGWGGLIARLEWGLSPTIAAIVAVAIGTAFLFAAAGLMFFLKRATHDVKYDPTDAVGKVGTVYMTIPEHGKGSGKVRVDVQGRSVLVDAVSVGPAIDSFADVRVTEARDANTLIVEPL